MYLFATWSPTQSMGNTEKMSVVPTLRWRQEDEELRANLCYKTNLRTAYAI